MLFTYRETGEKDLENSQKRSASNDLYVMEGGHKK